MAYRGYKVVAFTPSGRERVQSILIDNLSRHLEVLDEYQIWVNTDESQVEDTQWLRSLPELYDWVTVIERDWKPLKPKQMNTGLFYPHTLDEDTIYIRLDDDIVYVDDDFFKNLLDFRIDNPRYFLVMGNIWNNAITSYIHQKLGHIPAEPEVKTAYCMDAVGWRSGKFAEMIHNILIEHIEQDTVSELYFDRADLTNASRFSVSTFCYFGKDFKEFEGVVGYRDGELVYDEEVWLTEVYPILKDKLNTICGTALVAHYSFFSQRPLLDKTDILKKYSELAKRKLSDSYYDQLAGETPRKELPKLENFVLPPSGEGESPVAESLRAEADGYTYKKDGSGVILMKDGKQIGKMVGNPNGVTIDRKLVALWKRNR